MVKTILIGGRVRPGGRGRATDEQARETRHAIVEAARRLFMEFGYRAVSTRRVADACGLTQPALYHHFADKREIYMEVLRTELVASRAGLERISQRHDRLEARLVPVARYVLSRQPPNANQMFSDIEHELNNEQRRLVGEWFFTSYVLPISAIFAEGLESGHAVEPLRGSAFPGKKPTCVTGGFLSAIRSRLL
jgi:AcrR family transcriptional regulator